MAVKGLADYTSHRMQEKVQAQVQVQVQVMSTAGEAVSVDLASACRFYSRFTRGALLYAQEVPAELERYFTPFAS